MARVTGDIKLYKQSNDSSFEYKHYIYIFYLCLYLLFAYSRAIEYAAREILVDLNIVFMVV